MTDTPAAVFELRISGMQRIAGNPVPAGQSDSRTLRLVPAATAPVRVAGPLALAKPRRRTSDGAVVLPFRRRRTETRRLAADFYGYDDSLPPPA